MLHNHAPYMKDLSFGQHLPLTVTLVKEKVILFLSLAKEERIERNKKIGILSLLISPMLLHLAATLPQVFFPALQEAGFLNVRLISWLLVCQNGANFS